MRLHRRPVAIAIGTAFLFPSMSWADSPTVLDDVVVSANRIEPVLPLNSTTLDGAAIADRLPYTGETAGFLKDVAGASLYTGGGVSSLPVLRGLADDRIRISIDGMSLNSACGNHMNPPMSYIDPSNVGQFQVISGVTPVSLGGDSIGD